MTPVSMIFNDFKVAVFLEIKYRREVQDRAIVIIEYQ